MNSLGDYQWKHRLIVIGSDQRTDGLVSQLEQAKAGIDDRDIVWFVRSPIGIRSNQETVSDALAGDIIRLLDASSDNERVLLIGKDGGIKSREPELNLSDIFRRIDAMPMRIREMKEQP